MVAEGQHAAILKSLASVIDTCTIHASVHIGTSSGLHKAFMPPKGKGKAPAVVSHHVPHLDDQPAFMRMQSVSEDNRRIRETRIPVAPPSPEILRRPRGISSASAIPNTYASQWTLDDTDTNMDDEDEEDLFEVPNAAPVRFFISCAVFLLLKLDLDSQIGCQNSRLKSRNFWKR